MRNIEFLQRRLAISLVVSVGALSVAGCEGASYSNSNGIPAATLSHNTLVVKFPDNSGQVELSCSGTSLRETSSNPDTSFNHYFTNSPDCNNGVLNLHRP